MAFALSASALASCRFLSFLISVSSLSLCAGINMPDLRRLSALLKLPWDTCATPAAKYVPLAYSSRSAFFALRNSHSVQLFASGPCPLQTGIA